MIDPEGAELDALARVVDFRGLRVLDVGCGDGRLVWRIAPDAAFVLGIDEEEDEIAAARAAIPPELEGRVHFEAGDVTAAELEPAGFDVAFLTWSL